MKRLLAAATAPVLALALTLSAAPAHAAGVKDKDLVSLATVAQSFPALASGERSVASVSKVVANTSCKKHTNIKAKSAKTAAFVSGDAAAPGISEGVAQMKSVTAAKKVLKGQRILSKCKKVVQDGITSTIKPIKAPKLGQERVAFSVTVKIADYTTVADVYTFRQKGRIISLSVVYGENTPQRTKAAALAKKVYKAGL